MTFRYESKGTADDWTEGTVEADSLELAWAELDRIYDIRRDESGAQTNTSVVQVRVLK